MRVAVTGLYGVIGQDLIRNTPRDWTVIDLHHQHPSQSPAVQEHLFFDLTDTASLAKKLATVKPEVIIHLAALTHIDRCELDRENGEEGLVWQINVRATGEIARYAADTNTHLVYMSTECVFNGRRQSYAETASHSPKNWYGETKAAAEASVMKKTSKAAIVRAVVAYAPDSTRPNLWQSFQQQLQSNAEISAVNDQRFTPTFLPDITAVLRKVSQERLSGIFHVSPTTAITPHEFAQVVAQYYDLSQKKVVGQPLRTFFKPAAARLRLKNAVLSSTVTQDRLGLSFTAPHELQKV